jgi:GT2 family glycosyltransferase
MAFVGPGEDREVELSIIVVSYNSKDVTLEALRSLFQFPPVVPFEVLVLDNDSPDDSFEAIDAAYPQIRAIKHPTNVGFAAGNNILAERARGRRLLLLNPDTISLPNTFDGLWRFAENEPERGIWGGRTYFADHSLNRSSCWARPTVWSLFCSATGLTFAFPRSRLFNSEAYGDWPRDRIADVDIVSGCFFLIDTALWRRLGGFDKSFFMYAEEADLCLRAKKMGAKPGISPEAEVIHLGGASEATAADKFVKTARGRATLMRKHWSALPLRLGLALMWLGAAARLVGSRIVSGRNDKPGTSRDKWTAIWNRRREWLAGY